VLHFDEQPKLRETRWTDATDLLLSKPSRNTEPELLRLHLYSLQHVLILGTLDEAELAERQHGLRTASTRVSIG
jgi:hypothetical protein